MTRGTFAALLILGTFSSDGLAGPRWKAPGLAKSLRDADKMVERAQERHDALEQFSQTNSSPKLPGQDDVLVESVRNSSLFAHPQQAGITPLGIRDNPDGSAMLFATWSRDAQRKNFHSMKELEEIADWDRRVRESQKAYERRKQWHRNSKVIDDPAITRGSEVEKLTASREKALQPIHERAAKRAERYRVVKLELTVPQALAEALDRESLLRARIVPALFQATDCELDFVDPEFDWPPFVSRIRADFVEIDPSVLKEKTHGQSDQ